MCTLRGPTMYDANENCSVKIVHLENLGFVFSDLYWVLVVIVSFRVMLLEKLSQES